MFTADLDFIPLEQEVVLTTDSLQQSPPNCHHVATLLPDVDLFELTEYFIIELSTNSDRVTLGTPFQFTIPHGPSEYNYLHFIIYKFSLIFLSRVSLSCVLHSLLYRYQL